MPKQRFIYKTDIVIVDSGIDVNHRVFNQQKFTGINLFIRDGQIMVDNNIQDNLGHGTAIAHKIIQNTRLPRIFIIKIFQDKREVEELVFLRALEFIRDNIDCKVINISAGLTTCANLDYLHQICIDLYLSNRFIVSAFHHDGSLSYPASFKEVIGVEMDMNIKHDDNFYFVDSNYINVFGRGSRQKLANIDSGFQFVSGASFAAAAMTNVVLQFLINAEYRNVQMEQIKEHLKANATKIIKNPNKTNENPTSFKIENAIVFPFNKEVSNLIKFHDQLCFNITDTFHVKYSGYIGKYASEIMGLSVDKDFIVKNIDSLDWSSPFDTVILGHNTELSKRINIDLTKRILMKCIESGKNIFSFDPLENYEKYIRKAKTNNIHVYYPTINEYSIPSLRYGKLTELSTPVIGVFGTSSMQGKFSLQLDLRKRFLEDGYHVGQLGTEPSSPLYGFNKVYPMGYNSNITVSRHEALQVINDQLRKIEETNPDVIIVGSQSGTIPEFTTNALFFPFKQIELLLSTNPDIVILCVNYNDNFEYVHRTIKTIESISRTVVLGLVIYPMEKEVTLNNLYKINPVTFEEIETYKDQLEDKTKKTVFVLGEKGGFSILYNSIIEKLS